MAYGVKITEAIESLKEFADFLSANYETLQDVEFDLGFDVINVTPEELAALAQCRRPFDNRWQKNGSDTYFKMTTNFGAVEFQAYALRSEVCTAVPTGRKTTKKQMVKAPEYEEVEVDEVAWVCEPVLVAGRNGHVDAEVETADF